jgi:hypothetical protein
MRPVLKSAFWLTTLVLAGVLATSLHAQTTPIFRKGVAVTRLFDTPLKQSDGTYATPPFGAWTAQISQSELIALKNAGFDFIRLPIDPGPFLAMPDASRPAALAPVFNFLSVAMSTGFRVLIELRPTSGTWSTSAILQSSQNFALYQQFVTELAAQLGTVSADKLALELMNEPQQSCATGTSTDWLALQPQLYAAARAVAPRLRIMVTGDCLSTVDGLSSLNVRPFSDPYLYAMVHFYDPFDFTHQGAQWSAQARFVAGLLYPVSVSDQPWAESATQAWITSLGVTGNYFTLAMSQAQTQLNYYFANPYTLPTIGKRLDIAASWADSMGIPRSHVLLGEFGVYTGGSLGTSPAALGARAAWLHDVSHVAQARGFGWAVWGYHGSFGILADESCVTTACVLDPAVMQALFGP